MPLKYAGSVQDYLLARMEIDPDRGCWLWTKSVIRGYGTLGAGICGQARAHRAAYEAFIGPIPDGMVVCHRCDVPRCINPSHLFLGSQADNIMDMVSKKRHSNGRISKHPNMPKGERMGQAKLTDAIVADIRRRARSGEGFRALSREFGVDHAIISLAARGITWSHVTEPVVESRRVFKRLTPEQREAIVTLFRTGQHTLTAIAKQFDVTLASVRYLIRESAD